MQWLAELSIRRPIFATMLVTAFVVAGTTAFFQLGVDRFPNIDLPSVSVSTSYPGAAAEEVESEISQVIEDAVATVAGIDELRSISSDGASVVLLTFRLDRNIDAATQDVRDAVSAVVRRLPVGLDPPVIKKQDIDSSPVLTVAVSGPRDQRELYFLADRFVKNLVESAPGVGAVGISGSQDRAIQVNLDASRLAAYDLSIQEVREALARQNAEIPGGRMETQYRELTLRTLGRFKSPKAFEELVVKTVNGVPVRIRDLGDVVDGQKERRTLARLDGKPAVVVVVERQSGENTVATVDAVKKRLEESRKLLPDDVHLQVILDQSKYIKAAMHEVEFHLVVGSFLCCLVVLLFMGSWRSTIIASIAIPTSIVATFAVMRFLNFTLNNVTLLALVLMVGIVIDDAIVVLENIFLWIEEKGYSPWDAAVMGTREIGPAVLATTVSLVIVFLPVSFLSSVTGRLLFQFGVTATAAILVSLVVSFTLTPMMCSRMLKGLPRGKRGEAEGEACEPSAGAAAAAACAVEGAGEHHAPHHPTGAGHDAANSRGGFYAWIDWGYMGCLRWSMKHRLVVMGACILTIAANVPLYYMVRQDYVPTNVDESEFEVRLTAPEGANLAAMDSVFNEIEAGLRKIKGIKHLLTTVGSRGTGGINSATIYVRLEDIETRTPSIRRFVEACWRGDPAAAFRGNFNQSQKIAEVRRWLKKFPDVRAGVGNLTSLRQGAPVDIDFVAVGPDLASLAKFTEALRVKANTIPGIVDADVTLRLDKPQVLVSIDRDRAGDLGVDVREIADTLRIAVGGDDRVSRYRDATADDAYDVEIRLAGGDRSNAEAISHLYARGRSRPSADPFAGVLSSASQSSQPTMTRLDNLVDFRVTGGISRIDRLDRLRMVAVRANVGPGYALGDRLAAMQAAAQEIGVPEGVSTRILGRGKELERTFGDFGWIFALSFVFMYIVLAAQYEHLVHPLTILFSLPLAVPFGLVSLWLGGETLNLYSALGILVLFGVVKKASILQVDHTNQLRAKGMPREEAILVANRDRLRPILMTTIAFVAGMLPLLLGTGPGAEERRSIAVLAVGGQTFSLLLTLLAVPVMYSLLDDLSLWLLRRRGVSPAASPTPGSEPPPTAPVAA